MTATDRINNIIEAAVSCVKLIAQSRRSEVSRAPRAGETLVIMANGPSLARDIAERLPLFAESSDHGCQLRRQRP